MLEVGACVKSKILLWVSFKIRTFGWSSIPRLIVARWQLYEFLLSTEWKTAKK